MSTEHEVEKLRVAIGAMAELLRDYYQRLLMVGFSEEQAMTLVLGFQNTMFIPRGSNDKDEN